MKHILLLFIPLIFFFGCETDEDSPNVSYNCTNDECYSADGGSGQYATLDDCLSICGDGNVNVGAKLAASSFKLRELHTFRSDVGSVCTSPSQKASKKSSKP